MATPNQQNLVEKNEEYVKNFTHGHLELPPAKKYLVCKLAYAILLNKLYLYYS